MGEQLGEKLKVFKEITENIIDVLNKDAYDELNKLFEARQSVIETVEGIDYSANEFARICKELDIMKQQENLEQLMNEKKLSLRSEIDKLSEQKHANKSYSSKFSTDSIYFNKKL